MHYSQPDKMCSNDQSSIVSIFCYTSTAAVILFVECVLMEIFISAQCSDVSFKKLTISVDQIERHMWILLKKGLIILLIVVEEGIDKNLYTCTFQSKLHEDEEISMLEKFRSVLLLLGVLYVVASAQTVISCYECIILFVGVR
ncbi:hypothetical protein T05_12038 [Trichinella murrelli]|uniref:Uncharacterized protein n=1 Tax=Trichinella murrelli TaxID=144512 RepID=A0A0V0TDI6_9BILA|nr:hypothetical protein T05_12038 [Trichinella murrelli]